MKILRTLFATIGFIASSVGLVWLGIGSAAVLSSTSKNDYSVLALPTGIVLAAVVFWVLFWATGKAILESSEE